MVTEVAIEFIIVVVSVISIFAFLGLSLLLFLGNNRLWRRSEATFNAAIVCLLISMVMIVIAALMYMFYPQYFVKTIRALFFLGSIYK